MHSSTGTGADMIHQTMVFDEFADNSSLSHVGFLGFGASSFWYASSKEFSDCHQDHEELPFQEASFVIKQNTDGGDENSSPDDAGFGNGEEKMDMLWEDFNDEMGRSSFIGKDAVGFNMAFSHTMLGYRFDAISPVKMSKRSNPINRRRGPSLRIILKVLKKLLLLSRSRCPKTHDF